MTWFDVPDLGVDGVRSLFRQLEETERYSAGNLHERQLRQLLQVVRHAHRTVPFYRLRLDEIGLPAGEGALAAKWSELPLLSRRDIQTAGDALHSSDVPVDHGPVRPIMTSGSTAQPVIVQRTALETLFWRAFTLRDHTWHKRDYRQTLAAIRFSHLPRARPPHGMRARDWGYATRGIVGTGPAYLLGVQATVSEQARWLRRVDPGYVLGYPSALHALAAHFQSCGYRLPNLREIRTFGEILEPECRAACKEAFGMPVVDMYSSQEVGYIALQCPECEHYHVQSENVFVEILDAANQPCGPGEVGRVVVTALHNFAMPLLRYDIGDYAEVGDPCPCGSGLPVLKRIMGRQRNILLLPNGERRWPALGQGEEPESLPPFYQFQVVQKTLDHIEVRIVRPAPFTPTEADRMSKYVQQTLGHPFDVTITYVESIPRSPSGKFEDFVSEVS